MENEDKNKKKSNMDASNSPRLASFRNKDLNMASGSRGSQSGLGKFKFAPNINVKREKLDGTSAASSHGRSNRARDTGRGGNQRGGRGGRGRGGRDLMQSKGLWADGVVATVRGNGSGAGGFGGYRGGRGGGSFQSVFRDSTGSRVGASGVRSIKTEDGVMQQPVVSNSGELMDDTETDECEIQTLMNGGRVLDREDHDTNEVYNQYCNPTVLTHYQKVEKNMKKLSMTSKDESNTNEPAPDNGTQSNGEVVKEATQNGGTSGEQHGPQNGVTAKNICSSTQASLTELLSADSMFFVQLPSTLPSIVTDDLYQPTKPGKSTSDTSDADKSSRRSEYCLLKNLPSGQIGTVKVYKSGKAFLCLGKFSLPIELFKSPSYLEEVVHAEIHEDQSQPSKMKVLSQVENRLVVKPDFSMLLESSQ